MEKFELKYIGAYSILLDSPGFTGKVAPGQVIEVFKEGFDELSLRDDYEVPKKVTKKKDD